MSKRYVLGTIGLLALLSLPGAPALAKGNGGHGHGQGHNWQERVGTSHAQAAKWRGHGRHIGYGHLWRQVEGTVGSYDGTALTLHPWDSSAVTLTVTISASTVITSEDGAAATLAVGEKVHVACTVNGDGSLTATRVEIQRRTLTAAETPEAESHGEAAQTPEADRHGDAAQTPEAQSHVAEPTPAPGSSD